MGVGESNDRGFCLLEFASNHKLTLANTLFPHKMPRRKIWHALNGEMYNQTNYILACQKFKSRINKAQMSTFPGADIGSDHDMVLMILKLKLKKDQKKNNPCIRYDVKELKDPGTAAAFQPSTGGTFAALTLLEENTDSCTESVTEVLHETATEVLGKRRKKFKPCVTDDILDLCDERRELKKIRNLNPESGDQHNAINKNIRR